MPIENEDLIKALAEFRASMRDDIIEIVSSILDSRDQKRSKKKPSLAIEEQSEKELAARTWKSYSDAYAERYQVLPVRNAKINSQLVQFVRRLGKNSPDVAGWFIGHNAARYALSGHSIAMLLTDAEKLHTEWLTGNRLTQSRALRDDRTQSNLDTFTKLINETQQPNAIESTGRNL